VEESGGPSHNQRFLQTWWNIFMERVQPHLAPSLVRSSVAWGCAHGILPQWACSSITTPWSTSSSLLCCLHDLFF
jgi:hypothetical protein